MKFTKLCKRLSATAGMALALAVCLVPAAQAEVRKQNLVQLVAQSQSIVAGTVVNVTDGVDDRGIPFTEVTIAVGNSPKGNINMGDYTFRQFGLLKPRTLPNGHRMVMVTPAAFPEWHKGEYVVAFLYHPAAKTGLQTTTALAQGKLRLVNHKLVNRFGNVGLFNNIQVTQGVLSGAEMQVINAKGPVDADALLGLIQHIVDDQLIQKGAIK